MLKHCQLGCHIQAPYAECHIQAPYAECHYADCRCAESRGTTSTPTANFADAADSLPIA